MLFHGSENNQSAIFFLLAVTCTNPSDCNIKVYYCAALIRILDNNKNIFSVINYVQKVTPTSPIAQARCFVRKRNSHAKLLRFEFTSFHSRSVAVVSAEGHTYTRTGAAADLRDTILHLYYGRKLISTSYYVDQCTIIDLLLFSF